MARALDYGLYTTKKTPALPPKCQSYRCGRPGVLQVRKRWRCQKCLDGAARREKELAR